MASTTTHYSSVLHWVCVHLFIACFTVICTISAEECIQVDRGRRGRDGLSTGPMCTVHSKIR